MSKSYRKGFPEARSRSGKIKVEARVKIDVVLGANPLTLVLNEVKIRHGPKAPVTLSASVTAALTECPLPTPL